LIFDRHNILRHSISFQDTTGVEDETKTRTEVRVKGCDLHIVRAHELQRLAAALANFGGLLALANDAGLLEEAAAAHFAQDAISLNDFVESLECGLERFIVIDCDTRQLTHPSLVPFEVGCWKLDVGCWCVRVARWLQLPTSNLKSPASNGYNYNRAV
jgi:hypothetical protein